MKKIRFTSKTEYVAPAIESIVIAVERGFAISGGETNKLPDYYDNHHDMGEA